MADDAGERTEAATPRRRQEAREKGQVARSTDLSAALLLLGGLVALRVFGPQMTTELVRVMRENLAASDPDAGVSADVVRVLIATGMALVYSLGPLMGVLMIVSAVSGILQVGFLFTTQPLAPKLDKLNPVNGVKRLFNTRTLVQFGINLLKLALVSIVAWFELKGRSSDIMLAMAVDPWRLIVVLATVLFEVGLKLALVLLIIALIDFAWQRYKHERDLRMTRQEVKEELRRMEGDPIIRQRRRKMQFAAALQRIRSAVPTADVVVTNPTELAVAIKYDAGTMAAPRVVAKGADILAKKIREIAVLHGIPIVERKPLAQALYRTVDVGQEVPEQFYKAIAEILAYVYQLNGRSPPKKAPVAA